MPPKRALIQKALKDISEEAIRSYLTDHGKEFGMRITSCITQAEGLIKLAHYGPSLVMSVAAIELIIRYLLIQPLSQGAFLSEEWASILSDKIASGRSADDRELLPAILMKWDIDITKRPISGKQQLLWETMHKLIWRKRNDFIHRALPVSKNESETALECAHTFISVVAEIAKILDVSIK